MKEQSLQLMFAMRYTSYFLSVKNAFLIPLGFRKSSVSKSCICTINHPNRKKKKKNRKFVARVFPVLSKEVVVSQCDKTQYCGCFYVFQATSNKFLSL